MSASSLNSNRTQPSATAASQLSISEMVRILDVASEVRRSQNELERQFRRDESRAALREKLAAVGQSEARLSDEQLDAAIDWYFDNLHRYRKPKRSFGLVLAHLYIRRWAVLGLIVLFMVLAAVVWGISALFSSEPSTVWTPERLREQAAEVEVLNQSGDPRVTAIVSQPFHFESSSQRQRQGIQLEALATQLRESYTLEIDPKQPIASLVGKAQNRMPGLVLLAFDSDRQPTTVELTNIVGTTRRVSRWVQETDAATLAAVRDDLADGVLDHCTVATKEAGSLDLRFHSLVGRTLNQTLAGQPVDGRETPVALRAVQFEVPPASTIVAESQR